MKAQIFNYSGWVKETDTLKLQETYVNMLKRSGFNILDKVEHFFKPQGYTLLILLGESHFAIHTFPEHQKSYIELSSCVEKPFNLFIDGLSIENLTIHNKKTIINT